VDRRDGGRGRQRRIQLGDRRGRGPLRARGNPDSEEYRRFQVSVATLNIELGPISPLARWLVDQYRHLPPFVRLGGTLAFGDSPLVTATAFDPAATPFTTRTAGGREIRMAHSLDPQLNFADFTALLRAHARRG
jgi:hypothetical protein